MIRVNDIITTVFEERELRLVVTSDESNNGNFKGRDENGTLWWVNRIDVIEHYKQEV